MWQFHLSMEVTFTQTCPKSTKNSSVLFKCALRGCGLNCFYFDVSGNGDFDTRPELYVHSGDWEAQWISSHLSIPREWKVSNPRTPISYIEKSQRVTLIGDLFAKKPHLLILLGISFVGTNQVLP